MEPPSRIVYKGMTYKRNPLSEEWAKRVYYQAGRGSGRGYLHRDVYADTHGPIPKGMHVHHKDHDPFNNDPSNLTVLTPKQHNQEHGKKFDEARMRIFRETTLAAAAEWHRSPAGIEWHRDQGRRSWQNRELSSFTCPECGVEHQGHFPGRSGPERHCSPACRQRADRRARKYFETATCAICKATFSRPTNFSKRQPTCSRSCGAKLRWRNSAA